MKRIVLLAIGILCVCIVYSQQSFTFAFISDTHIGNQTAEEDLRRTINNINADSSIAFIVITGDITEFGSDEELALAKRLFDMLLKPWYIIPGNHDSNWSESGSNSFKKIFGAETFHFIHNGYLFLGTASGPNMRMSPGQVPREHLVWMDSVFNAFPDQEMPVIFLNHYPQDSSLNNWFEVIDRLKTRNTQLILCGHGHLNKALNFEGIPAVMGRSNLRAKDTQGAFNVVTVTNGVARFEERNPLTNEQKLWTTVTLKKVSLHADSVKYPRPSYQLNSTYPKVKTVWQFRDNSDIGSSTVAAKGLIIASNTGGSVYALNAKTGKRTWTFQTGGKIYSTPAIHNNRVVVASTDNNVYCLDLQSGRLVWKHETSRPIVANPLLREETVFIGSSDGKFRALFLENGRTKWTYDSVKNFVVTRPLYYLHKVYFGSWANSLYALDAKTGHPAWTWSNGSNNRMFSPAACHPVGANGRIFIVAPDRYMTALDAQTGSVIWRKQDPALRVRESMGLSLDSSLVYAKTMDGFVIGISTTADTMIVKWTSQTQLGYELAPTPIVENKSAVFIPSDKGVVTAVSRLNGNILWKHKISNSLITGILPISQHQVVVATMDGRITLLSF